MKSQPEVSTKEVLAELVERVTYHNVENGFCVLRARARGHRDLVTVVGHAGRLPRENGLLRRERSLMTTLTANNSKPNFSGRQHRPRSKALRNTLARE